MKRWLAWPYWLALCMLALCLWTAWVTTENRRLARQGEDAKQALCVFKRDLAVRVAATHTFLELHPNGIAGIDAETLRQNLMNQEVTLKGLVILRCPEDVPDGF